MAITFEDRVSTRPYRYKVTPDSGSPYYVTLERADQPSKVGTPLNASVLNQFAFTADIANLHVWSKHLGNPSNQTEAQVVSLTLSSSSGTGSVQTDAHDYVSYSKNVTYSGGAFALVNPSKVLCNTTSAAEVLRGKYIQIGNTIYQVLSTATFSKTSSTSGGVTTTKINVDQAQTMAQGVKLGYVSDLSSSAYPSNGELDGYWYVYHKQVGD